MAQQRRILVVVAGGGYTNAGMSIKFHQIELEADAV